MLFLLFQLGDQGYAIPAGEVREILPMVTIRPLAHAPDGIAGIADYRGTPLPVVDLARLVLTRDSQARLSTRLIVVHITGSGGEPRLLGLIAERVTDVVRWAPSDFRGCGVATAQAPYLGDMARFNEVLVQRIDLGRLLPAAVRAALFASSEAQHAAH